MTLILSGTFLASILWSVEKKYRGNDFVLIASAPNEQVFVTGEIYENDVVFSNDTGKLGKRNSEFSYQELNLRLSAGLPITNLDALPLSYRRLVGAKAIKQGSWDKHPAYC